MTNAEAVRKRWRATLTLSLVLLVIWAAVGLGAGILFADSLHGIRLGGFPLGFWFAQQGSIFVFVLLILAFAIGMDRIDRRYRRDVADPLAEEVGQ